MTKTKIVAIPAMMATGKIRWRFATPSVYRKGELSKSLKTWANKRDAIKAGQREFS